MVISALMNFQDDKPEEKEQPLHSYFDNGILQHSEVGTDNEIDSEISPSV